MSEVRFRCCVKNEIMLETRHFIFTFYIACKGSHMISIFSFLKLFRDSSLLKFPVRIVSKILGPRKETLSVLLYTEFTNHFLKILCYFKSYLFLCES